MTTERSSSVDFVSPFLELSGISVVLRKPEFRASMTKFLSVLKAEVWLRIYMQSTRHGRNPARQNENDDNDNDNDNNNSNSNSNSNSNNGTR